MTMMGMRKMIVARKRQLFSGNYVVFWNNFCEFFSPAIAMRRNTQVAFITQPIHSMYVN